MHVYMIFVKADRIDDDTVYYRCPCGETHAKDNAFDFYSNRFIFRDNECGGEVCIHVTEATTRILPPKLMKVYEKRKKEDNYYKNLSRMMRRLKRRSAGRNYLGQMENL